MPKIAETPPDTLRPYLFHGIDLQRRSTDKEAIGDCPWCGREGKFSVNVDTGMWRCFVCNEGTETGDAIQGGNSIVFIRKLWELSLNATSSYDYAQLVSDRGFEFPESLIQWGVCKSVTTGNWLVSAYNELGAICQLYQYLPAGGRRAWLLTPTLGHKMFGVGNFSVDAHTVDLCEGLWDGIAWWEALGAVKKTDDGNYVHTSNRHSSLLEGRNVGSIPTAEAFFPAWACLFSGKVVNLICQNDHPRKLCRCKKSYPISVTTCPSCGAGEKQAIRDIQPASLAGMERISKILSESPQPPLEINYLKWSRDGYDLSRPSGYDVRNHLCLTN